MSLLLCLNLKSTSLLACDGPACRDLISFFNFTGLAIFTFQVSVTPRRQEDGDPGMYVCVCPLPVAPSPWGLQITPYQGCFFRLSPVPLSNQK
ncbi:hypothetical protein GGR57DRAFT_454033 [Xylariaceae sp. FL1272]|nr:hypothetical protein GGR57DRAFT_454033 [Xylariaceae sp. FL1272]